jgi:hypothetical protein
METPTPRTDAQIDDSPYYQIAIAEACGWKYDPTAAPDMKYVGIMCRIRPGNNAWQTEKVPDYLNDLNAMHEAEKVLTDEQYIDYANRLSEAAYHLAHGLPHVVITRNTVSPAAAQRAEAFLKALNLWQP